MPIKSWLQDNLAKSGADYSVLRHDRVYTAQGLAHREHVSGRCVAKVVVLIADGGPVQAVVPASRHVDQDKLQALLGARQIRMASEDEMRKLFPDCELGAEPPLPHWESVGLWVDESLRAADEIVFAGGTHEDGVRMRFADWLRLARPDLGDFSRP